MGMIDITVRGSFRPNETATFAAGNHGHAKAVADAIKWLAEVVMPAAIDHDHLLHDEGSIPLHGFGR